MPKISVILTSSDHDAYLRAAIDSVLNQSYADFELIIWDDASQDQSWSIIEGFRDDRIRTFRNEEKQGEAWSLNRAIHEIAGGSHIAIHHPLTLWDPDKLVRQLALLDANPGIGATFTNISLIDHRELPLDNMGHPYQTVFSQLNRSRHAWLYHFFHEGNPFVHASALVRKECYRECGPYRSGLAHLADLDMWIRLCLKHEIHLLQERLVRIRLPEYEFNMGDDCPESRVRKQYEHYKLLQNFREIETFEDLKKTFPAAEPYDRGQASCIDFAVAMTALKDKPSNHKELFGQDLLLDILRDPERAERIEHAYGFRHEQFIEITGKHDVFLQEHVRNLNTILNARDAEIARLNQDLIALHLSTSWRITAPLRWVAHQFKRATHLARIAPRILKLGGGMRPTLAKALRIYRNEGLSGVKHSLLRAQQKWQVGAAITSDCFDRNTYQQWVDRYDTIDDPLWQHIRARIETFPRRPKISVVLPVYDPPVKFLDQAIHSVRKQLYQDWELCIADDASKNPAVRDLLEKHASEDARIKIAFRKSNGHISAASNTAAGMASGEFVALLDHDDQLPEHALFWVARTILEYPDAGLIYSDEDKVDENGNRFNPYFKCDLNPELLLAQNMICHLGVYRRELLQAVGGFRAGFEGAQDYDLALRVVERLRPDQVRHIPRVLYHWRAISGSTALSGDEKSYAVEAGRRAVREHLQRRGLAAEVSPAPDAPHFNRVRFSLPKPPPLVTLIIPTRDRADLLEICIKSILKLSSYPAYEIIIVDNGSTEPETARLFSRLSSDQVRIVTDNSPFNFSALNNRAARQARGELLCLMNNDIEILTPDWLEEMVSFAIQDGVGCVGARLWYPDGRLQHGGVIHGLGGVAGHSHKYLPRGHTGYFHRAALHQDFSAVTGACLVVRREIFEEVGGLDESLAVAFNDIDFCIRVTRAGYRNVWTPYAEMIHHESVSRGHEDNPDKQARFASEVRRMQARWGEILFVDPAYSPNLTLVHEDFSLAWPPRVEQA